LSNCRGIIRGTEPTAVDGTGNISAAIVIDALSRRLPNAKVEGLHGDGFVGPHNDRRLTPFFEHPRKRRQYQRTREAILRRAQETVVEGQSLGEKCPRRDRSSLALLNNKEPNQIQAT
jgi:hypothetical protein